MKAKLPFVLYRHPNTNEVKGIFQKTTELFQPQNYTAPGFVFAPFDASKPTILFPLSDSDCYSATLAKNDLYSIARAKKLKPFSETAKATHIALVKKGIDFLKTTKVQKVVLSRRTLIDNPDFNILDTFKRLLQDYIGTMVYVWYHPDIGLWLGATPENLLKVTNTTFATMALAATQVYRGSLDVVWEAKEQQEQQFVIDFIVETLGENSVISKTKTIKAGSLLHICTTISGKISQELTLTKLIKGLHPTPAVCGLPKEDAKTFILENEGYNREYYTGFLGELHMNNASNLFVNLRCMQVLDQQLAIYSGGGITIDSIPLNEWKETVAKSKVILSIL